MTKRLSLASAVMTAFAALFALLLLVTPAMAHHKDGHDKGGAGKSSTENGPEITEDNDTNDNGTKNNVADEGDNKHPSGKDRSVENGSSGNQGNSTSDPDDDGRGPDRSNGGADKPDGPGGDDLADQDGNNGCGNDDDFEDDNEGWCGKPPKDDKDEVLPTDLPSPTPSTCPAEMVSAGTCGETPPTEVDGEQTESCPEDETMAADEKNCEAPVVLGSIIEADTETGDDVAAGGASNGPAERPAGAALPFTGASIVLVLVVAMGLLGVGFALFRTRRN